MSEMIFPDAPPVHEYLLEHVVQKDARDKEGREVLRMQSEEIHVAAPLEVEQTFVLISRLHHQLAEIQSRHDFKDCCGISAIQLGIPRQVSMIWTPKLGYVDLVNPKIISADDIQEIYEGCLSFFHLRQKTKRPANAEIERYDLKANKYIRERFTGPASFIAVHEIDHQSGILSVDRALETLDYKTYLMIKSGKGGKIET